jgi:predicted  nucleic acid-binding Zn-ribbon protein
MSGDDIAVEILRGIRDELRTTNARIDQTNTRLDQTNTRLDQANTKLDQRFEELGRGLTESEIRTSTAMTAVAGTLTDIKHLLADRLDLRERVERCEHDIEVLKARSAR